VWPLPRFAQAKHRQADAGRQSGSKLEVVDADFSKYFDTIPHERLLKLAVRRLSDRSILHLLRHWLDARIMEKDGVFVWQSLLCRRAAIRLCYELRRFRDGGRGRIFRQH
jgi:hypothetical protein